MAMVMSPVTTPTPTAQGGGGKQKSAPPFDRSTRLTITRLAGITRPAGGGLSPAVELPTYGLLAGVWLQIRGSIGGTVGTVNALGGAVVVQRVTLKLNSGTVVFSLSGANYHYLFRDVIDAGYVDVCGQTNARDAITPTAFILDMVIPLTVNLRDPIGILLTQNRQTTLTLEIEWTADATVTSTGTFLTNIFTVTPHLLTFSVPPNPGSMPPLRYIHQVVDQQQVISGAGDWVYDIPRGNTYMRIILGVGIGATGADSWNTAKMRVNQSQYIFDMTPASQQIMFWYLHGRVRELGQIIFDFLGTSGLGSYGTTRDLYDSNRTTDFQTVVDVTTGLTAYVVREQLIDLRAA